MVDKKILKKCIYYALFELFTFMTNAIECHSIFCDISSQSRSKCDATMALMYFKKWCKWFVNLCI